MKKTLDQIGEKVLLDRLKPFMAKGQIDDDTAQIICHAKELLINTDVLVENVHFSKRTTSPEDVGWRSVAANLSDLAASGVNSIIGINVGLVVPSSTEWEWVDRLYSGMHAALKEFGGEILGGDCSHGEQKTIAITAIGTLGKLRLHRSNALPGDCIVASGIHGLSRLGLAILQKEISRNNLKSSLIEEAINWHQKPSPPLFASKVLMNCKPNSLPWRAAGTDSSDGLLAAVQSICESSNCQAELDQDNLPKHLDWPKGPHWDEWCINGGEDFQLILSLPNQWGAKLTEELPSSRIIGRVKAGDPGVYWKNKKKIDLTIKSAFDN